MRQKPHIWFRFVVPLIHFRFAKLYDITEDRFYTNVPSRLVIAMGSKLQDVCGVGKFGPFIWAFEVDKSVLPLK